MQRCGYKAKLEPDWTSTGPVIHRQKRPMTRLNAGDIPPTTMTVLELFFLSFFSLVVVVQIFSPRVFSSSSSSRGFYFFLRPSLFSFSFVFFLALFNPPQRHARSSHSRRCWNTHTHTHTRTTGWKFRGQRGKAEGYFEARTARVGVATSETPFQAPVCKSALRRRRWRMQMRRRAPRVAAFARRRPGGDWPHGATGVATRRRHDGGADYTPAALTGAAGRTENPL